MVEAFIKYLESEKRYSKHTVQSYSKDLCDFGHFAFPTTIDKAEKSHIRSFVVALHTAGFSKRSINRKLSVLRSFYKFAMRVGLLAVDPTLGIDSLKVFAEKQIPFSRDEMDELSGILQGEQVSPLTYMIIELLYQTGIRKSELCDLVLDDWNPSKRELHVTGKGNKQRIVPVGVELAKKLSQYIVEARPESDLKWLLLSPRALKLNQKFVYLQVKNYLSLVSAKTKRSPHMLRHSFATHLLGNGAEISVVKSLLGHSSLASTQVYTHADIEKLKDVFEKSHPRSKK